MKYTIQNTTLNLFFRSPHVKKASALLPYKIMKYTIQNTTLNLFFRRPHVKKASALLPYRQWSEENCEAGVEDIRSGEKTYAQVGEERGIPKSTLCTRYLWNT